MANEGYHEPIEQLLDNGFLNKLDKNGLCL
jgi:hypothetical protein